MGDNYYIVQESSTPKLEETVEKFWKDGWRPCGAPIFVPLQGSIMGGGHWYQALVKRADPMSYSYSVTSSNMIPDVIPISQPTKKKKRDGDVQ